MPQVPRDWVPGSWTSEVSNASRSRTRETPVIGGRRHFVAAWIVGALIAIDAIVTTARTVVAWPQVAALLFMAPAAVVGGATYVGRQRAHDKDTADEK